MNYVFLYYTTNLITLFSNLRVLFWCRLLIHLIRYAVKISLLSSFSFLIHRHPKSFSLLRSVLCLPFSLSLSLSLYWFKSHLAIQLRMYKLKFFCKPCIVQNMKTIIDAFPVLVLSYSSFMFIISGKSYFLNAHPYTHTRTNTNTHIWN